ncbi:alpha-hydroxy acid oxidase [Candidatus Puniceispirillum marinum]|uniref:L-lactate dehydrogenase, putative n=1 Tax=Puniceispirillum marinum (strain IMCC1322) TaxID=488538 RepID=D5BRT7_PUNMI|nr:alpha-hydroxy acid oxidase [Candidatus Puniceispirillum marinum]ADE38984.1 L-lactate dehydrogenase, putative [Candidatus Puniceispirillum marinum IMCC1322]
MDLMNRYPRLSDLRPVASRRIPKFVFAYLDSGTGHDTTRDENRAFLDSIQLTPQFLRGRIDADISTTLFGKTYKAPFGVAPIGLASLIWPGAEQILGAAAKRNGFPYALSTVASDSVERVSEVADDMTWFQLYAPRNRELMKDLLSRARACGVKNIVLTADVPSPSRRERMRIAGAPLGSRGNSSFSPQVVWQSMMRPEWAIRTLLNGGARFRNMEPYAKNDGAMGITKFIGEQLNGSLDWDYLADIRAEWEGKLILKGILHGQDAARAVKMGVDALVISNHGGRQLDAAPQPLAQLAGIRAVVGDDIPLIVDSGIQSGLDVVRALAMGADFVMIGRAFMYAVAALGKKGGDHAADILLEEVRDVMAQLGLQTIADVKSLNLS